MVTQTDRINGVIGDLGIKAPCRIATTASITLSGLQSIDGVTTVAGDRVLVKDQTTASENGIWVADSSAWTRAPDFDGARDVVTGTMVLVNSGSANIGKIFRVSTTGTITPGTTSITLTDTSLTLLAGLTASAAELNYTDGVTSAIQTQLDAKLPLAGGTMTGSITMDTGTNIVFEGATADAFEITLSPGDPTADTTVDLTKVLESNVTKTLTKGFSVTPYSAGTKTTGTFTPDEANGNFQYAVNGGAHTLAPPTNNCTLIIQYTNDGSAGTITTSGFTVVDGDTISTTNGDDFFFYITKCNGFSHLTVKALQ